MAATHRALRTQRGVDLHNEYCLCDPGYCTGPNEGHYLKFTSRSKWHFWNLSTDGRFTKPKEPNGILQVYAMDSHYEPPPNFQGPKDNGAPPGDPIEMSPELGKIFGELSWTSRLQLLDQYYPTPNKTLLSMNSLMEPMGPKKLDGLTPSPMEPQPQELPSQQTGQLPEFQGGQGPPSQQQRSRRADRKVGMSAMKIRAVARSVRVAAAAESRAPEKKGYEIARYMSS
ncbi:hypothetical protein MSG28_015865 [Choristoneura fumiferana]|uniref:Uncharacterized protein n=1 Tax=Choristoneura fumiferana TaxID=7141 RepID=A0ACC0K4Z0_CHOFU|nr:hypothetical protein MSG28_015865 [Choristoneura fumiferana]